MLFNQQQCFIYSTASFLSILRAKKVEKLRIFLVIKQLQQMTAYRNFEIEIPETTISGFADIKKKNINANQPQFF